jgi:gluconolactonase
MLAHASRPPGPRELFAGLPDAIVDLQTEAGVQLVGGEWRYQDARIEQIDFVGVGDDLGPSGQPNRTYDVAPHAEGVEFDDSAWQVFPPADTMRRLGNGRTSFNWYRLSVTIPDRIGEFPTAGSTVVFEVVVDDYAEVWVNGQMPLALGQTGGQVVAGFNAPNRVVLAHDIRPGQRFLIAVFGINGPLSVSPHNYIWLRSATLDFYSGERARAAWPAELRIDRRDAALDAIVPLDARAEQVAGGFVFTEGPVWAKQGYLLFSSPNTNVIYRWSPDGAVDVFRAKSGYAGVDIGTYTQPGSNGLTFDPQGLLTICQHGNRRVVRVEPHGNVTVLADRFEGKRLNSPNDLVYRSDGTLYFTDPPFGLPAVFDDPRKELPFSGVFHAKDGVVALVTDELTGPNGIALSPDERYLYVGNWDLNRKVVMRYELAADGSASDGRVLFDMTDAPGEDAIDGLKVDQAGNLYVCGPGGIWILSPDGRHLGSLELPESPHNVAWGDADARSLYVTALTSIYRIRLNIPGVRPQ